MTSSPTYDLFVSYADADRAWVEGYLLDALDRASVRYHSEDAFALGVPRLLEFERAIKQSQRTLLVLSPAYLIEDLAETGTPDGIPSEAREGFEVMIDHATDDEISDADQDKVGAFLGYVTATCGAFPADPEGASAE